MLILPGIITVGLLLMISDDVIVEAGFCCEKCGLGSICIINGWNKCHCRKRVIKRRKVYMPSQGVRRFEKDIKSPG